MLQKLESDADTDADASYVYSFETETDGYTVEEDETKLMDVEKTLSNVAVTQETEHPREGTCWLWIKKIFMSVLICLLICTSYNVISYVFKCI